MSRLFIGLVAIACAGSAALAQQPSKTINCLDAPKLCNCEAFPLACMGGTAHLSRVGKNKVRVAPAGLVVAPIQTVRCDDLAYESCKALGCSGCKDR
jgi:hypothetical protein